jgi:hypothetical protein
MFPTYAWLTCPWLVGAASALESAGAAREWTARAGSDASLAAALRLADSALRSARQAEGQGEDMCAGVGIAGQRDVLKVKCLHAHVALALIGVKDPIGRAVLQSLTQACPDRRCATQGIDRP